jgi:ComF family protein
MGSFFGSKVVTAAVDLLRRAIAPRGCAACDVPVAAAGAFCAACAATIEPAARGDAVLAFGSYGGALATALNRLKHEDRPDLARPLGALLAQAAAGQPSGCDALVPVPLHAQRLAERGYNQAALLAAASGLGAVRHDLLVRALATTRQQGQSARARARNVVGAFTVPRPARVLGLRLVLVDDVCTTGATLAACREALCAAGAAAVHALVVARATPT